MIKIKNNKTDEELTFSDDWEVAKEKKEAKIHGDAFIELFKHWVRVNLTFGGVNKAKPAFRYDKDKDMLSYVDGCPEYGIGFFKYSALKGLEDGKLYSYNDLVGEE